MAAAAADAHPPGNPAGNPAGAALGGLFYVVGGYPPTGQAFNVVQVYNPAHNSWAPATPLPSPLGSAGAAAHGDRLYVAGGDDGIGGVQGTMFSYNPPTQHWQQEPPMPTPRSLLKMTHFQGSIYAIGGTDDHDAFLTTVERYDPAHHQWQAMAHMNIGRRNPGVAVAGNHIVVVGGAGGTPGSPPHPLSSSEIYDPQHDSWRLLPAQLNPGRASLTSASRAAQTILAIGGVPVLPTVLTACGFNRCRTKQVVSVGVSRARAPVKAPAALTGQRT